MALQIIKQTDLAQVKAEKVAKEQRVADVELVLADQIVANIELQARVVDAELAIADLLANQTI